MEQKSNKKGLLILIVILILIIGVVGYLLLIKKVVGKSNLENNYQYYIPSNQEIERTAELEKILKNNLPKMDGSTSTIPLEGGIISGLFDIAQETAEKGVVHSTTYGSFDNLLKGKCDIIFSTPLSQEQYKKAKEANVELVETPIVYEGFVFVVNAKNPVDTLTQKQIQDIYSGKITNWKEVGGNNAEIIAYQRNETSGSQNYMKEFMKNSNLMKPRTSFVPESMYGLMDAVATYDNAENAIGYSVYAYAADMYGNGNEIKFIKVDGVEPTKATMASKEYPLLNYNYAIYDKAKESKTTVKELVEWILTYNGQNAMVNAGYIPIKNVQTREAKIVPYTSLGTGKEKKNADDYYYSALDMLDNNGIVNLKNKQLQDEINKFIQESENKLKDKKNEYEKYVELLNKSEIESMGIDIEVYNKSGIYTKAKCINGYLSVQVILGYRYEVGISPEYIYDGYSKVYDLYTGKELSLSDLYYKNTNFVEYINEKIEKRIPHHVDMGAREIKTKRTFSSLPKDVKIFGLDTITFTKDNPFFIEGVEFDLESHLENVSIIYEARPMDNLFENNVKIYKNLWITSFDTKIEEKKNSEFTYSVYYVDTKDDSINNIINSYIDNNYIDNQKIKNAIDEYIKIYPEVILSNNDGRYDIEIQTTMYGNKYIVIDCSCLMCSLDMTTIFDLETQKVTTKDAFEKWKTQNKIEEY